MILKGKQSFFDVPGVETVSGELGPRRPEERSVITQAVVYITGAVRRAKGPVSLDIVERTADEAARAGNGKREGAENAPILELLACPPVLLERQELPDEIAPRILLGPSSVLERALLFLL